MGLLCRPREASVTYIRFVRQVLHHQFSEILHEHYAQATHTEMLGNLVAESKGIHPSLPSCLLYLQAVLIRSRHEMDTSVRMGKTCIPSKYICNNYRVQMTYVWDYNHAIMRIRTVALQRRWSKHREHVPELG